MRCVARVIVVSGTLGAGKTYTAGALRDALVGRGARCGVIDVDWLCQNDPAPNDDPYNDRLAFLNLKAVWPNYAASELEYLILARVVGDTEHRAQYAAALPGCEIRIVRIEASPGICAARLTARMPTGPWLDGHLARTNMLAERLRELAVEDLVVSNDEGCSGAEVADDVLRGLDW